MTMTSRAEADTAAGREEIALADLVARLRRAMRRAARASDPDSSLSVAQLELLSCLAENPNARPGQLAQMLRLAPNSVTTLVRGLQARQLIERVEGSQDRRTVSLSVTDSGDQAVQRWRSINLAILGAALTELDPSRRLTLVRALPALRQLVDAIDDLGEPLRTEPRTASP